MCRKELAEAIEVSEANGRRVERVSGDTADDLSDALSSTGTFYREKTLVVVEGFSSLDSDMVVRHHEEGDSSVAIVLYAPGSIKEKSKLGEVAKALPKNLVARFEGPKPWEREEWAAQFVVRWVTEKGLRISPGLAKSLVGIVGTDLGILEFEVEKAVIWSRVQGEKSVTAKTLKGTVGVQADTALLPLVDALANKDLAQTIRYLNLVKSSVKDVPGRTLRTLGWLNPAVIKWLQVRSCLDSGETIPSTSARTGLKEFHLKKKLLPAARKWKVSELKKLLADFSHIERGVRSGWIDPWTSLESAIFRSLQENVTS